MASLLQSEGDAAPLRDIVEVDGTPATVPQDLLTPQHHLPPDVGPGAAPLQASPMPALPAVDAAIATAPSHQPDDPTSDPQAASVLRRVPRLDRVPTLAIRPAETTPRRRIDEADLQALASSIKKNGLAQPLLVRVNPERPGVFELFAGYRRWRAALMAEVAYVPVIVFEGLSEAVALELSLLENLHRRDLTIIEEAEAFRMLADRFGRTQDQIAILTGRSRSQVSNMLRLLALPDEVRDTLHRGQISFGHGRALLVAADPATLARRVVAERLTVRETELLAAQLRAASQTAAIDTRPAKQPATRPTAQPAGGDPIKVEVDAEHVPPAALHELRTQVAEAIGIQVDVCAAENGASLLIRGRSPGQIADMVATLCDALKLLRMNRAIDQLSRDIRGTLPQ
jgi:ParB family chromosome partitioning protein